MDDNTIIAKIVDILKNASPTIGLKDVLNTHPNQGDLTQYPIATVTPDSWQDAYVTLRDTKRVLTVAIRIYNKLEGDDTDDDVQLKVRELRDKVLNIVEKNITLDNIIDWTSPTQGKYLFAKTASDVYIAEIMMQVQYRFNRS